MSQKFWRRLRGQIIRAMIGDPENTVTDPVVKEIVEPVVERRNNKYFCKICRRWFTGFNSIFYHITNSHYDLVKYYVNLWKHKKFSYLEE